MVGRFCLISSPKGPLSCPFSSRQNLSYNTQSIETGLVGPFLRSSKAMASAEVSLLVKLLEEDNSAVGWARSSVRTVASALYALCEDSRRSRVQIPPGPPQDTELAMLFRSCRRRLASELCRQEIPGAFPLAKHAQSSCPSRVFQTSSSSIQMGTFPTSFS